MTPRVTVGFSGPWRDAGQQVMAGLGFGPAMTCWERSGQLCQWTVILVMSGLAPGPPVTVPVAPWYAPVPPVTRPLTAPVSALMVALARSWPWGRASVTVHWAVWAAKSKRQVFAEYPIVEPDLTRRSASMSRLPDVFDAMVCAAKLIVWVCAADGAAVAATVAPRLPTRTRVVVQSRVVRFMVVSFCCAGAAFGAASVVTFPGREGIGSTVGWEVVPTRVGSGPLSDGRVARTLVVMHPGVRSLSVLGLVAVGGSLSMLGVVTSLLLGPGGASAGSLLSVAVVAAFTMTGMVVVAARPGHRIGWLLLGGGTAWAVGNAGIDAASYGLDHGWGDSWTSVLALTGGVVRDVGWYLVVLGLPIFFPTGRLFSSRWRRLPGLLVVVTAASVVDTLTDPHANLDLPGWRNPVAPPHSLWFIDSAAFLLSLPLALVVMVMAFLQLRDRWRHGTELERGQLRAVAAVAWMPVLAGPLSFVPGMPAALFSLAVLPVPVAVGYAVLARGLYDLRTATSRTAVWLLLSATVASIYALVIVVIGNAFGLRTAAWLPAVAIGAVAFAFAPLRDRLQHGVNRVLFGRWEEPYEVLTRIGQRLEATSDIDHLLDDVTLELAALGLRSVEITDVRGRVVAVAAGADHSSSGEPVDEIPLMAYGERVGTLRFQPQTSMRPSERRLIEDLAVHLGGALHDHHLTGELREALERVVLAREEERRRLRRDLHDGLGPALAGHLLRLDVIAQVLEPDSPAAGLVDNLRDELRATVAEVRRVVEGLRPPAIDELGLAGALAEAVKRLTTGTSIDLDVQVHELPQLPAAAEVAAFRIVTEAVTNVVRHAQASTCCVEVTVTDGSLRLAVTDDGVGPASGGRTGNGLQTMRERAEELGGQLRVTSGRGTQVLALLPLGPSPASSGTRPASTEPPDTASTGATPAAQAAVTT